MDYKEYTLTTDHGASSDGEPVCITEDGEALGPQEIGIWDILPGNYCGRVDIYESAPTPCPGVGIGYKQEAKQLDVIWSGYGDRPDRIWAAVKVAFAKGFSRIRVYDNAVVEAWA